MKTTDWIDAKTACAVLGVRPQTLYAYVSRKRLRARADQGDARRSLYARSDVEALAQSHKRPRARDSVAAQAIRWGDPVLTTSISHVIEGELFFGADRATECARTMTLEEVAARHCGAFAFAAKTPEHMLVPPNGAPVSEPQPDPDPSHSSDMLARAFGALGAAAARAEPAEGRNRAALVAEGAQWVSACVDALLGTSEPAAIHDRLARKWHVSPEVAEVLRQALVLLSDHELNPSTFAVRVCASTGGSLPAALLAGLATLTGPRHGGVVRRASAVMQAALTSPVALERTLSELSGVTPYHYGFGHPLYPEGDPRARHLLAQMPATQPARRAMERVARQVGQPVNIDGALCVMRHAFALPDEAAFTIFAAARLTGWLAHAVEQTESGVLIRPRARYQERVSETMP